MSTDHIQLFAQRFVDFYNDELLKEVISMEGTFYGMTVKEFINAVVIVARSLVLSQNSETINAQVVFMYMFFALWAEEE